MNESLESVKTLSKCIRTLTTCYLSYTEVYRLVLTNMEAMMKYFKLVTEGYTFTLGQTYLRQEAPKGELGCYILHGDPAEGLDLGLTPRIWSDNNQLLISKEK